MSRRMACSMTVDAVRNRTKTVTRRSIDSWQNLKPGDRLTLVEKGMGLKKGEKQVVLAEVEVVDVRVEWLIAGVNRAECWSEGFPFMRSDEFCAMWIRSHRTSGDPSQVKCRRIEWRYVDAVQVLP